MNTTLQIKLWRIYMGYKHIEVKPVAGFIGAEIGSVDREQREKVRSGFNSQLYG
ncbi:MAG: hypothetical protein V7L14_32845 [Nostoc sp.]|uniref:hypothetical protein n=1 Tax=Nostoc sp. TaxID=1180 RepID=UPI002FF76C69